MEYEQLIELIQSAELLEQEKQQERDKIKMRIIKLGRGRRSFIINKRAELGDTTALCVTKRYSNSSEQNNFRFAYLNIISHPIPIVFPQSVHFEVQIS